MIFRTVAAISVVAWVGLACPAGAQPPAETRNLGESRRVTVLDTVVPVDGWRGAAAVAGLSSGRPTITPGDVTVLVGGQERPVVAVAAHDADEPWAFLIYLDLAHSDPVQITWAVDRILEQRDRLTDLGPVEVVLADPEPRLLVPATRDPDAVLAALSGLVVLPRGDDQIGVLRSDLAASAQALRAAEPGMAHALGDATGVKIGPLRLHRPEIPDWSEVLFSGLPTLVRVRATHEEDRDPEAARAYLALGRVRRDGGDLEGARRALRLAIHHFADDADTAAEQAEAYLELARLFERQDEPLRSRLALRRAWQRSQEVVRSAGRVVVEADGAGAGDPEPLAVLPVAPSPGAREAVVLVEDLVTGSWAARVVELP